MNRIINQRPIGRLYRVIQTISQLMDLLFVPIALFTFFMLAFVLIGWFAPWFYNLLSFLNFPDSGLKLAFFYDASKLAEDSIVRILMVLPSLVVLTARDFFTFPIRSRTSHIFCYVMTIPILVSFGFFVYLRQTSMEPIWFDFLKSLTVPFTVIKPFAISLGGSHSTFGNGLLLLSTTVYLTSVQFFMVALATSYGEWKKLIIIPQPISGFVKKNNNILGMVSELIQQSHSILKLVFLMALGILLGSLVYQAHRFVHQHMIELLIQLVNARFGNWQQASSEVKEMMSTLSFCLPSFLLGTGVFISLAYCYGSRWILRISIFIVILNALLFIYVFYFPGSIIENLLLFYMITIAFVSITPIIIHVLRETLYLVRISYINSYKKNIFRVSDQILLLRPFALDSIETRNPFRILRLIGLHGEFHTRLEEIISKSAYLFGPLVAVGKPNEIRPKLGAIREYLSDIIWQDFVEKSVRESSRIVFIIDESAFTGWETDKILEHQAVDKTIFIVPPKEGAAQKYFDANPILRERLGLEPNDIENIDQDKILLITSNGKKSHQIIKGAGRIGLDYLLALDLAFSETKTGI